VEQQITSKEKILKKIRQALIFKQKAKYANIDLESNIYTQPPPEELLLETFAKNLVDLKGQFVYCTNQFDCIDKLLTLLEQRKWKQLFCWEDELQSALKDTGVSFVDKNGNINKAQVSLTTCEALIARTGSVLVSSKKNTRTLTAYPPVHIVIAYSSQIVMEIKDGMQVLKNRYGKAIPSMVSFISGPSRTSDIEKTLVIGAQGPKELFVFVINDVKHDNSPSS
jgi:L-lactate dehydrogenase complex protein LldG